MKMVHRLFFFSCILGSVFITSCKKGNIPSNGNAVIVPPADTAQPVVLYSGVLIGGEMGDRSRGNVTVEKLGNRHFLVFKNFSSNSGPDVHVYFSKTIGSNATPPTEYKDLGLLKFTSGTFNYELPAAPDVANFNYVLIWCAQFRIQFGYAPLQ